MNHPYVGRSIKISPAVMLALIKIMPSSQVSTVRDIVLSEDIVDRPWVFPCDKDIDYGPDDEASARKYGVGHEGSPVPSSSVQLLDGVLFAHPKTWEVFESVMNERGTYIVNLSTVPELARQVPLSGSKVLYYDDDRLKA